MSDKNSRDFEDPKIILTVKLANEQDYIRALLSEGQNTRAAKHLSILLLGVVIAPDEKEMLELRKKFTPLNYHSVTTNELFKYYELTTDFLNRTYFADFHKPKPKFQDTGHI
jgi:hypothetical protein